MRTFKERLVNLVLLIGAGCSIASGAGVAGSEPVCADRNLNGAYGFNLNGVNFSVGQYAMVGRFVSDGKGRFEGSGTQNVKGTLSTAKFVGTFSIQADCTGTATLSFIGGPKATLEFVLVQNGDQVYM